MVRLLTLILATFMLDGCTLYETAPSTAAATMLPELSAEEAAAVPEGARVEIERRFANPETRATMTGVVLKAGPEGLALANCLLEGHSMHGTPIMSKLPHVGRLFRNTGIARTVVPVQWVPLHEMSAVRVLEPPPADYVAPPIKTADSLPRGLDFDYNVAFPGEGPRG